MSDQEPLLLASRAGAGAGQERAACFELLLHSVKQCSGRCHGMLRGPALGQQHAAMLLLTFVDILVMAICT